RFLAKSPLIGRKPVTLSLADPNDTISYKQLLHRPQVELDKEGLKQFYSGKRVVITGAGGSIGSEIARQALSLGASHIVLIDHSELALYDVEKALRYDFPNAPLS